MKTFLSEYGKALTTAIMTLLIFALSVQLLLFSVNRLYPETSTEKVDINIDEAAYRQPIIMLNSTLSLAIEKGDKRYNGKAAADNPEKLEEIKSNFKNLVTAYERSYDTEPYVRSDEVILDIEVYGVEQVDTTKNGVYDVTYYVKNSHEQTFLKEVSFIVK